MGKPLLLFDVDDTLLDFTKSQKISFLKTLEKHGLQGNHSAIFSTYVEVNDQLWLKLEAGEIAKDVLNIQRFQTTFEMHGMDVDHREICEIYLDQLAQNIFLIDQAVEVCEKLNTFCRMGIITNGIQSLQEKRMALSPLKSYFDFMVVSEHCGFAKPDQRIFSYALKVANHDDLSTVKMIGDRLETDILGANRVGIESYWFNPNKLKNETEIKPNFEFHSLPELLKLVL